MKLVEKPLTELQKKFARYYVEAKYGNQHLSNTECAIKAGYSPDKHMARLNFLGQEAEKQKMIGVALRAEELRGKVAGYYVDRQIIKNKSDDYENMSVEELEDHMNKMLLDYEHCLTPEAKDIIERKQKYNEEQRKRKTNGSNDG